jgi:hypothetical protein
MGLLGVSIFDPEAAPEAGRKTTRILRSCIEDLSIESHWYRISSDLPQVEGWVYGGEAYNRGKVGELFVARNWDRLNKELVSAFGVQGGFLLHSLQNDCVL